MQCVSTEMLIGTNDRHKLETLIIHINFFEKNTFSSALLRILVWRYRDKFKKSNHKKRCRAGCS